MGRHPVAMADVLAELMARQGYARLQGAAAYEDAWREAAGPLVAGNTRVGPLRRGTLEIIVTNSTLVQELGFQRQGLVAALNQRLPDQGIRSLRFRVGPIE